MIIAAMTLIVFGLIVWVQFGAKDGTEPATAGDVIGVGSISVGLLLVALDATRFAIMEVMKK